MIQISIDYLGELRCEPVHEPSQNRLITDAPVDNQGKRDEGDSWEGDGKTGGVGISWRESPRTINQELSGPAARQRASGFSFIVFRS